MTPLWVACRNAKTDTAASVLLLDRDADVHHGAWGAGEEVMNCDGATALYIACYDGNEGTAKMLLDRGADPSAAVTVGYPQLVPSGTSLRQPFCWSEGPM
eukprot:TRINITY_DN6293_c0_g1_i2.p3 TRINITY_DN6293_c0_g1~~TRINITY_DN6293_c0_g1_i2.p3  ORF type:complete len:100 (-),score=15.81 TRINITY_DN6293_c0_g1_i2:681-980(-)